MTGPATGIQGQLGFAAESTYGTAVTPTRFWEFVSESTPFVKGAKTLEAKGIRAGARIVRSDRWTRGEWDPRGAFEIECHNKGQAILWKHLVGSAVQSQPDAGGSPTVYDYTITPADLSALSGTLEVGWKDTAGNPFKKTVKGAQALSWELDVQAGGSGSYVSVKPEFFAQDLADATGVTSAAYTASTRPYSFVDVTVSIAGSPIYCDKVAFKAKHTYDENRYPLGTQLRNQAPETDYREYTVDLQSEFADWTAYDRFISGTEATLVINAQGPVIANTYSYQLQFTTNVRFDGTTPAVPGRGRILQPLSCTVVDPGSNAFSLLYRTTDTTA